VYIINNLLYQLIQELELNVDKHLANISLALTVQVEYTCSFNCL